MTDTLSPARAAAVDAAAPAGCTYLHDFFVRAARRWPDRIAVDVPPGPGRPRRTLATYAQLQDRSEAIASHLSPLVAGECVVAILLPRDSDLLYAAQLAVLMAGAAYTCIEVAYPDERIRELLLDCDAVALLTDAAGGARVPPGTAAGPVLDAGALARQPVGTGAPRKPPPWLTPSSLAYVIYTSGTSGTPKGTLVEHRSVASLVASDLEEFGLGPGDRVVQNSSPVYDSSVEETWLAFAAGATLVVMDDDAVRAGPDQVQWLRRERVTVFCPPPTLLRATGCLDPETALPDLRLLYVGGEALPLDLAERWARGRRLENGYGPTECTVTALRATIRPGGAVSIGVPIRGNSAWVLDERLEIVPDGAQGELCLGGAGLARGYHRRPELTSERFPVHPLLGRIYRTGDLARRAPDGTFFFDGRIDSQVKVRGHRVELEEIEARLSRCEGVREAACRLVGTGASQLLVAFVVPVSADAPPDGQALREVLRKVLPDHMVPSRIGCVDALPRTPGGKLDRGALPSLEGRPYLPADAPPAVAAPNSTEWRIAATFARVLGMPDPVPVTHDFFLDLGGDSLNAAVAVSLLRDDPATASLTVRDVYEYRTVNRLAERAGATPAAGGSGDPDVDGGDQPRAAAPSRFAATSFQTLWLLKDFLIAALASYAVLFHAGPALAARLDPWLALLLALPASVGGLAAYTALAVMYARWTKRLLIGRYVPVRVPVWGSYYLRHWAVQRAAATIPWWLLEGTDFQIWALRALGARIGERVHIHREVDLAIGGWDLLDIGDDVTLGQNAAVRLVELESREMLIGPVVLGSRCTLETGAGVGSHTCVEPDALLANLAYLPRGGRIPRGERWDGIPAGPAGLAPVPPAPNAELSPVGAGIALLLARWALAAFLAVPATLLTALLWHVRGRDVVAAGGGLGGLLDPWLLVTGSAMIVLAAPLTLGMAAAACRLMGQVRPGAVSRWSIAYLRIWLKPGLVDAAGRWLYGTLFWPHWLRLAGARIGRGAEISNLIDTIPEMIDIGEDTFCADGIYLAGPRVHRGSVEVERAVVGDGVFLGNGVVVAGGVRVPERTLLGINTVADPALMRPGTGWFGHPPFELPRRRVAIADSSLTHRPSAVRYATRLFWELLRFSLPLVPALAVLLYLQAVGYVHASGSWTRILLLVPVVALAAALIPVFAALTIKWSLLGRVQPGERPLWSGWNSRWDFYCVAWNVYVAGLGGALRETWMLPVLLRAAGVRIGRGVVLGGRFAEDLPDPDMLTIEYGATVEGSFQAHTFEDRVLKNDRVIVRRGATTGFGSVLLYGADVGAGTGVGPHSVVMKYEHLLPAGSYEGFPVQLVPRITPGATVA